jgi:AcrR family transcriptional regulator
MCGPLLPSRLRWRHCTQRRGDGQGHAVRLVPPAFHVTTCSSAVPSVAPIASPSVQKQSGPHHDHSFVVGTGCETLWQARLVAVGRRVRATIDTCRATTASCAMTAPTRPPRGRSNRSDAALAGGEGDSGALVDGRRAGRDRNLSAVVDALLDLFTEGNLRPGADEIAARSGVSRRSVFRYFDDLDSLDRVAIERQSARVMHLLDVPDLGEGPVTVRIERLIAQRLRLFEAILPVARVSRLRAPFEPVVADELARSRTLFRRQIERHFNDELGVLARRDRNAILGAAEVLCSFEAYELLRLGHGQAPKQIGDVMRAGLERLFVRLRA